MNKMLDSAREWALFNREHASRLSDEVDALRAEVERLRAAMEWALDNAGTDHPSYPYRVPDNVWARPYLVSGDCGGVGEEHFATALEAVEAALAQESPPCCQCGSRYARRGEATLTDGRWVCSGDCERAALAQEKPHDR